MIALAIAAQALDLLTWALYVGPGRDGNPLVAPLGTLEVIAVKVVGIALVVLVCRWQHYRAPLLVAAWLGVVGAFSNTTAVWGPG